MVKRGSTCSLLEMVSRRMRLGVASSTAACRVVRHAFSRSASSPMDPGKLEPWDRDQDGVSEKQCEAICKVVRQAPRRSAVRAGKLDPWEQTT